MTNYLGRDAVIVGAVRTPIGKGKASGALHDVLPADLLAHSLRELVARTGVDPAQVDDVIAGAVTQVNDQAANIARNALLGAGFPESVPGVTIDRQCGSSQQAISFAAQGVLAGAYDLVIAGGVESMSRVPMGSQVSAGSNPMGLDMTLRYPDGLVPQGISAELIAAKWGFSRTELDEFSAESHNKAARATKDGLFDNELIPIAGLATDEIIRPATTVETLATLQPAFYSEAAKERFPQINWEITPGNSSPLSDGSAAVLITTSELAKKLGLRPLARIHTTTVVGSDPLYMLTGVIPATEKVLQRAGLTLADIDLFEVNEAFAPVVLAWAKDVGADLAKTNVNGGAIAIGHPLGASGARIMTTLVNALEQRGARYGLQTMCEGGGMANATIIERLATSREPEMAVIRAAAVQLSPVLYSREGTVQRVVDKIEQLGRQDVQFAIFPETVVPYYPYFSFVQRPFEMRSEHLRLLDQAVTVPSPAVDAIGAAAARPRHGGVHRGQRARRWFAVQHAVVVRRRRHPDSAPPQDHADLSRTHDLGTGRREWTAGRRQRGRAHRPAGVFRTLQPAGAVRDDRRRRADPLGHVPGVALAATCLPNRMEISIRKHALESGAFVVNATAWLDADQQAQIMADTGCPIGPISGGCFTAIIAPAGRVFGRAAAHRRGRGNSRSRFVVDRRAKDPDGQRRPLQPAGTAQPAGGSHAHARRCTSISSNSPTLHLSRPRMSTSDPRNPLRRRAGAL